MKRAGVTEVGTLDLDVLRTIVGSSDDWALALITATQGPAYRNVGSIMAIGPSNQRVGSLSSGCIESDLAIRAQQAIAASQPELVRYGEGSSMIDLRLPCGGTLDIFLLPAPNRQSIGEILRIIERRAVAYCSISLSSGAIEVVTEPPPVIVEDLLTLAIQPPLQFRIFGFGPEAVTFVSLTRSLNFDVSFYSPVADDLEIADQLGCTVTPLKSPGVIAMPATDARCASVLFFHDHDWEPGILRSCLNGEAFYIGAQGSIQARANRDVLLREAGCSPEDIRRIKGPIGLIRSVRDPRMLAVSVMAEVLDHARGPVKATAPD